MLKNQKRNQSKYEKSPKGKATKAAYRKTEKIKTYYKRYYLSKRRTPTYRFLYIKNKAKIEKLEFSLTKEEYINLISQVCYYCELDSSQETGRGLDRIDNTKGYTLGNVLPACGNCNKTRGDRFTVEETKVMINALIEFRRIA